jgi:sensor histidine kinase YesM
MNNVVLSLQEETGDEGFLEDLEALRKLALNYTNAINALIFSEDEDKGSQIAEAESLLSELSVIIGRVHEYLTEETRSTYRQFNENRTRTEIIAVVAFLIITLINLATIFLFTNNLMRPVKALTAAAREVSEGSFHVPSLDEKVKTEEFRILTAAFKQMAGSISSLVGELSEMVDVERRLKEEELKNERNRLLLKEAELLALQSQVNPHFIFNTLNIIAKIAYTEEADKTATIIGSLAKMLRYSLGSLKKVTTLEQEVLNLEDYIFIQKTRFAERLEYIKEIECDISAVQVPCLTIQPIVENAIMHGIENREEGGYVRVRCFRQDGYAVVEIEDNGVGIPGGILENIFKKDDSRHHKGHTTGLGINNVKERLEKLYNRQDIFEIRSEEERGTTVRMKLPVNNETGGEEHIQTVDR